MSEELLAKCEYRSICPLSRVQAERDSLKRQCGDLNVQCLRLEAEILELKELASEDKEQIDALKADQVKG